MEKLRAANGELRLHVAPTLWVLQDNGLITRDDLLKFVERIDDEDGRRDNSYSGDLVA